MPLREFSLRLSTSGPREINDDGRGVPPALFAADLPVRCAEFLDRRPLGVRSAFTSMQPNDRAEILEELHNTLVEQQPLRLVLNYQAWNETMDVFAYWILLWTDGEDYFLYRYPSQWDLPTDKDKISLIPLATKIPKSYYNPSIPSDIELTPAPSPLPDGTFIKRYQPIDWDPAIPESTAFVETVLDEAQVCEKIKQYGPHRNVCEYRGYVHRDGFITGLCFQRHEKTLDATVKDGDPVDMQTILDGIKLGLEHLHGIGLVHVRPFIPSSCTGF